MQYKTLALSAFVATALAAPQATDASTTENIASIYQVLATALPSSLVAEAMTNPVAASSEISAEFAAGSTPTWFTALPTDIQTYLVPAIASATAGTNGTTVAGSGTNGTSVAGVAASTGFPVASANGTAVIPVPVTTINGTAVATGLAGGNMTGSASGSGRTSSAAGSSATRSSGSASASSSSAAGAVPTAVVGMGFAGVVAVAGLFAL
ncbi:hypothetical protein LTR62_000412 [Meristemomyces frigidus]|uniref:Uncharacterized protein n=1 Tax=Meristemomyces frigidus TaxID=1508187 RepID=A0AAN7TGX8_9PEZI|nr:hypothetical protein LTR62_000412 [Meristemomyces frigidus]